jgi:nickel/cobalt exporter
LSGGLVLVVLVAAALLALHALTPGHADAQGRVGSGGTSRNALTLGAVVTFTHTASGVVIGLLALLASQFLVPGLLVPALEIIAGLLVLGLGARLLRQRWRSRRTAGADHVHDPQHPHPHVHDHDHDAHTPDRDPGRELLLVGAGADRLEPGPTRTAPCDAA